MRSPLLSHSQALVSTGVIQDKPAGFNERARGNEKLCRNVSSVAAIVHICVSRFPVWERVRKVCMTL